MSWLSFLTIWAGLWKKAFSPAASLPPPTRAAPPTPKVRPPYDPVRARLKARRRTNRDKENS